MRVATSDMVVPSRSLTKRSFRARAPAASVQNMAPRPALSPNSSRARLFRIHFCDRDLKN